MTDERVDIWDVPEDEFEAKKAELVAQVYDTAPRLHAAASIDDFFELYQAFATTSSAVDSFSFIEQSPTVDPAWIATLEERQYPADFITLAKKLGNYHIEYGSMVFSSLAHRLRESRAENSLLTRHGYLEFAGDGAGNLWVFDLRQAGAPVCAANHDELWWWTNEAALILSDHFGVRASNNAGEHTNPNGLDLEKIYTPSGDINLDSPYFRQYFEETITAHEAPTLLGWLKATLEEAFVELSEEVEFDYPQE